MIAMNETSMRVCECPNRSTAGMSLLAAILIAAVAPDAKADYVYTRIDYPGATSTNVFGINATGSIVGNATLASGEQIAYVYSGGSGGTFAPLPAMPSGYGLFAVYGINDSGTIVGAASAPDGSVVGFLLNGSTYSFFSDAGRSFTEARSISSTGLIAGDTNDFDSGGNPINAAGYVYDPVSGVFADILIPDALTIIAHGNNKAGQVVGNIFSTSGAQIAFLRDPTPPPTVTMFQVGRKTRARGINDNGIIAGFTWGGDMPRQMGFVGNSSGYQLIAPNDSTPETYVEGINNNGQVGGFYVGDDLVNWHGFIGTPASTPTGTTSGGAYTFAVDVVPDTPVFIDPAPALGFDYAIGQGDPLFTTVTLPIGVGDSQYTLIVRGHEYPLAGGQTFDFQANGFSGGVSGFRVTDIETSAALDPNDPTAFPTQLTFSGSGRFTGTMTPLCVNHKLPPQAPPQAIRHMLAPCGN